MANLIYKRLSSNLSSCGKDKSFSISQTDSQKHPQPQPKYAKIILNNDDEQQQQHMVLSLNNSIINSPNKILREKNINALKPQQYKSVKPIVLSDWLLQAPAQTQSHQLLFTEQSTLTENNKHKKLYNQNSDKKQQNSLVQLQKQTPQQQQTQDESNTNQKGLKASAKKNKSGDSELFIPQNGNKKQTKTTRNKDTRSTLSSTSNDLSNQTFNLTISNTLALDSDFPTKLNTKLLSQQKAKNQSSDLTTLQTINNNMTNTASGGGTEQILVQSNHSNALSTSGANNYPYTAKTYKNDLTDQKFVNNVIQKLCGKNLFKSHSKKQKQSLQLSCRGLNEFVKNDSLSYHTPIAISPKRLTQLNNFAATNTVTHSSIKPTVGSSSFNNNSNNNNIFCSLNYQNWPSVATGNNNNYGNYYNLVSNSNNTGGDVNVFAIKEKVSNIKTFARFRPVNQMESDLSENNLGSTIINFINDNQLVVTTDMTCFTLNRVYQPSIEQSVIYDDLGKEMVSEVLNGYNGTIFTYGPTGSGKTYTMFGELSNEEKKGMVPRAADQIFNFVNSIEDFDVEFSVNCCMLEIYKENLYDLFNVGKQGIKIKESPQKGVYVHGLTQINISTKTELLEMINVGYQTKRTRETRLNEYSSRSHTIFTLEIQQKYTNGNEKVGKLNLIDLAGSEKVSKSQSSGESLEEAKKINLSLSCLGNVIHALTSNSDHVPYRESKLTRILQESLSGNYKTSLIVTCSTHASSQEETISSLKFATRAQSIKTHFKMNIRASSESMKAVIEQLKVEIQEYQKYRCKIQDAISLMKSENQQCDPLVEKFLSIEEAFDHFRKDFSTSCSSNNNNNNSSTCSSNNKESKKSRVSTIANSNNCYVKGNILLTNPENMFDNDIEMQAQQYRQICQMEQRLATQESEIVEMRKTLEEKSLTIKQLESDILDYKKETLVAQNRLISLQEEKSLLEINNSNITSKNEYNNFQIEILQKQVQCLVDSLCKSEEQISSLFKEKQAISDQKFEEYFKRRLPFTEIKLANYFKNSVNFNFDYLWPTTTTAKDPISLKESTVVINAVTTSTNLRQAPDLSPNNQDMFQSLVIETCDDIQHHSQQRANEDKCYIGSFIGTLDFNSTLKGVSDSLKQIIEFPGNIEDMVENQAISKECIIIQLKKQLINSYIINQHLQRTINALEWKQVIEYGKAKLKSTLNAIQTKHICKLETVLNASCENFKMLRSKIEDFQLDSHLKQQEKSQNSASQATSQMVENQQAMLHLKSLIAMQHTNNCCTTTTSNSSGNSSQTGFQKNLDSTWMQEIKDACEKLDKEILPLTYENAINEIKKKNQLLKKIALSLGECDLQQFNANNEYHQGFREENDRLRDRTLALQQELSVESAKAKQYQEAFKVEKKNNDYLKQISEELEVTLRNNLREENECWEKTIKQVQQIHEREVGKLRMECNKIQEKMTDVINQTLKRIQDVRQISQRLCFTETGPQLDGLSNDYASLKECTQALIRLVGDTYQHIESSQTTGQTQQPIPWPSFNNQKSMTSIAVTAMTANAKKIIQ